MMKEAWCTRSSPSFGGSGSRSEPAFWKGEKLIARTMMHIGALEARMAFFNASVALG
jgi:hypothetical protein